MITWRVNVRKLVKIYIERVKWIQSLFQEQKKYEAYRIDYLISYWDDEVLEYKQEI
jgi:hypothetical protein